MAANQISRIHFIARLSLAFVFIYHGLVPKIIWLSAVEVSLADAHHFGIPAAWLSPMAGMMEILLGFSLIFYTQTLIPVYLAMAMLVVLLIDVAIVMPQLLIEAFNPVTINLLSLAMGYIIIMTQQNS